MLDNVTNPAHVQALIASAPTGRFLITSRRGSGWHGIATQIRLDVLEPDEATQLLTRIITHSGPHDLNGVGDLSEELGYLPLAIGQAGAYIAELGITPQEYLRLFTEAPEIMFAETAEGTSVERTIARIWRVTLDHLVSDPFAGQLLRILAWYASEQIPRGLLQPLGDSLGVQRAVGRLAAYSMIAIDDDMLAVHRLVQTVARTPSPDDPHRAARQIDDAREQATALLGVALPNVNPWSEPTTWPQFRQLLPHIEALTVHAAPSDDTMWTGHLLNLAGLFLQYEGAITRATSYFERAHAVTQRMLGPATSPPLAYGSTSRRPTKKRGP